MGAPPRYTYTIPPGGSWYLLIGRVLCSIGGLCYTGRAVTVSNERRVAKLLGPGNYRRIARSAKLSPQHVARILRGLRGASFHVAARVAQSAGVTLDQLHAYIVAQPGLVIKGRKTRGEIPGYRPENRSSPYLWP